MNLALFLFLGAGAVTVVYMRGARSRTFRKIALVAAGLTFAGSFFVTTVPLFPSVLRSDLPPLEIGVVAALCGSFFFTLLGRGLAAKSETICSLLLMAAGLYAILAPSREQFLVALLLLWLLAGALLRMRGFERREPALRALVLAAGTSLGFGLAALVWPDVPWLLGVALVCLLGAFPAHFWMPQLLPEAPFLLAALAPIVLTRVAALAYVHFCPGPNGLFAVFGLIGVLWCACASFAADNLRERLGYFVGAQSCLALWALGRGEPNVAVFFLLVTIPPTVLWGVGASILFDRLKYLSIDRLRGVGVQLPRMNMLLIAAAVGIAFFPGSSSFAGLASLLEKATIGLEPYLVGAAALLLFLSAGSAYVRICFGEVAEDLRRSGDLNSRELAAVIPVGLCVVVGLWPGIGALLRALF